MSVSHGAGRLARPMKRRCELGCRLAARCSRSSCALACGGRRGKVAPGQAAPLRLGGRRCAPTPLRCSVAWPVAKLTALTSFAAFKQTATSQLLKRAARAATRPAMLGASEALRSLPGRAFAATVACFWRTATPVAFAAGAARRGRFGWRRAAQGRGRRARSARFVI